MTSFVYCIAMATIYTHCLCLCVTSTLPLPLTRRLSMQLRLHMLTIHCIWKHIFPVAYIQTKCFFTRLSQTQLTQNGGRSATVLTELKMPLNANTVNTLL